MGMTQSIGAWKEWVTEESPQKNSCTFKLCLELPQKAVVLL